MWSMDGGVLTPLQSKHCLYCHPLFVSQFAASRYQRVRTPRAVPRSHENSLQLFMRLGSSTGQVELRSKHLPSFRPPRNAQPKSNCAIKIASADQEREAECCFAVTITKSRIEDTSSRRGSWSVISPVVAVVVGFVFQTLYIVQDATNRLVSEYFQGVLRTGNRCVVSSHDE
jgi:hypothetical protein